MHDHKVYEELHEIVKDVKREHSKNALMSIFQGLQD